MLSWDYSLAPYCGAFVFTEVLKMKIGCHISIAKGFYKACVQAESLGATAFQVFTKSPRSLRPKKLNVEDIKHGREFCREKNITLVAHTPYITNLSTPKPDLQEVTVRSIREDLSIADAYGAVGAVVHCGKHVGEGIESGKERMIETLNIILSESDHQAKLLLENTAGQGTELGLTIEELVEIRNATDHKEKIGFCFDTCHAFAAGIWNEELLPHMIQEMEKTDYIQHLVAIHLNDSKKPFQSHKDRHEKIGKGEIGEEAIKRFLQQAIFQEQPVILETPVQKESEYALEIAYIKKLLAKEVTK